MLEEIVVGERSNL